MTNSSGWIKGTLLALLGILTLLIAALLIIGIPQNAAGMAAKGVCSAAFVAGRSTANLLADDVLPVSPVLKLISLEVDEANHAVSAKFAGIFCRKAVLLPSRGCVLDVFAAYLVTSAPPSPAPKPAASNLPWPAGDIPLV